MKKLIFVLAIAILVAGGAVGAMSTPSYAQGYGGYNYPPPPQNTYASPWVGSNTPWTYYNGDWFLNGILYYFFGNNYGWAPYYSYPQTYIDRPNDWYGQRWNTWYQRNPNYWKSFTQRYPYWRNHQYTQHYDQKFYEQHHRGQGGGWNQGFHGVRPAGTTGPGGHTPGTTSGDSYSWVPRRSYPRNHRSWRSYPWHHRPCRAYSWEHRSCRPYSRSYRSCRSDPWAYWPCRSYSWGHRSGGSYSWAYRSGRSYSGCYWPGGAYASAYRPCRPYPRSYRSCGSYPWAYRPGAACP